MTEALPPLRDYQRQAMKIAEREDRYAYYFDTGTGKTRTAVAIIAHDLWLRAQGRWVVITPRSVIPGWLAECRRWDLPAWSPSPTLLTKRGLELQGADRDGSQWTDYMRRHPDGVTVINPESLERIGGRPVWGVVVDESAIMQSEKAKITKRILQLAENAERVYLLSGNPSPNGPLHLWSQAVALGCYQHGWWAWANSYGYQDKFKSWHLRRDADKKIFDLMADHAWYLDKSEVLSLEEPTVITREFLAPAGSPTWAELVETVRQEGLGSVMRKRTEASGFFYLSEKVGEKKKKRIGTVVGHRARAEALADLLQEMPRRRVIIWYQFEESLNQIREILKRLSWAWTSDPEVYKSQTIDCQALVAHPRSIGKGTDGLQHAASNMIFYEISYSYDEYYQALSRLHRSGQTAPVTIYIMIGRGSVDVEAWQAIEKKEDVADALRRALGREIENAY